jgi:competence protein ComEA
MAKAIWKDYFSFSKKERIAVFILLIIIVVFVILPFFFSPHFKKPVVDLPLQQQLFALQNAKQSKDTVADSVDVYKEPQHITTNKSTINKAHLFYFDPNTLDSAGWQKIGLHDKTINTILNYRNKGGRFKQPEDLRKIYSLKKEEADVLIRYVQIKPINEQRLQTNEPHEELQKKSNYHKQTALLAANPQTIDINTATVEEFKSLPGIGEVLSNRIIKFRGAIHGFKSIEDIRKTYGLSDSTYQLIQPYLTINNIISQKN